MFFQVISLLHPGHDPPSCPRNSDLKYTLATPAFSSLPLSTFGLEAVQGEASMSCQHLWHMQSPFFQRRSDTQGSKEANQLYEVASLPGEIKKGKLMASMGLSGRLPVRTMATWRTSGRMNGIVCLKDRLSVTSGSP